MSENFHSYNCLARWPSMFWLYIPATMARLRYECCCEDCLWVIRRDWRAAASAQLNKTN